MHNDYVVDRDDADFSDLEFSEADCENPFTFVEGGGKRDSATQSTANPFTYGEPYCQEHDIFSCWFAHAPKEQGGFVSFTTLLVSAVLIVLIAASLQWALSTFGAVSQAVGS